MLIKTVTMLGLRCMFNKTVTMLEVWCMLIKTVCYNVRVVVKYVN